MIFKKQELRDANAGCINVSFVMIARKPQKRNVCGSLAYIYVALYSRYNSQTIGVRLDLLWRSQSMQCRLASYLG